MTGKVTPLNTKYPQQRPDRVTTYDLLSTAGLGWRQNQDTLVGQKGLQIYSRMANDEQVKAVLNFKRDAITARGWQFVFPEDSSLGEAEQGKRKRLFSAIIQRMRGSFSDALNVVMTGRAYGFSVTEKVYGTLELDGKEWPAINMLLGRDPLSFRFYTNEYGTLEKIEQQARSGPVVVDQRRVIHYVHAPEWDHVYGRSDLREAYRPWYIKDRVITMWPQYLERFAGGFVHAELATESALSQAETESLDEALSNAKALGFIRTPPGVKINVIHPPSNSDAYEKALQHMDLAIAKSLLVPNLLGLSHTGQTGAYSQSQTQLEAFFWTLNADATRLEECLNEQLFRDLGDQAWGDGEYPLFKFKPASLEQTKWTLDTWVALTGAKTVIPTEKDEAFIRKLLELPDRDDDDKTIAEKNQELIPPPLQDNSAQDDSLQEDSAQDTQSFMWDESLHPRGKTSERSTGGSFAPSSIEHLRGRWGTAKRDASPSSKSLHKAARLIGARARSLLRDIIPAPLLEALNQDVSYGAVQPTRGSIRAALYKVHDIVEHAAKGRPQRDPVMRLNHDIKTLLNTLVEGDLEPALAMSAGWDEDEHPRAKTSKKSTDGSFAPDPAAVHTWSESEARGSKSKHARLPITFATEQERRVWLARLSVGDKLVLPEAVTLDGKPPDVPHVMLELAGAPDVLDAGAVLRVLMRRDDAEVVCVVDG